MHHAVYAAPDVLRHCCKRFFVNGKMKGDVEICRAQSNEEVSYKVIKEQKKKLHEDINQGKETECSGCPWLREDEWPSLDNLLISHISVENHSVCNLRCTYCSETYYGGKLPSYDISTLMEDLKKNNALSSNLSLVWGGGESVLLESFETIFPHIVDEYKPIHNHLFTNATRFSPALERYLKSDQVSITSSIDAGTNETFIRVRGRNRLNVTLDNLRKYHEAGGDKVIIKYILVPENISESELNAFTSKIREFGLTGCSFQISSNFKSEDIGEEVKSAAITLYKNLQEVGATMINFDYHLRPQIGNFSAHEDSGKSLKGCDKQKIIVWGAGEYAMRLAEQKSVMHRIKFFVDNDPEKHGKFIGGISVHPPEDILNERDASVFIASAKFYRDIYRDLMKMGVDAEKLIGANEL
mgnify:FL=1